MSLLGLDLGTTGCKAGAFSEEGRCLATAYREYPALHPRDGWAELDSRLVWAQVQEVIAEVAARTAADPVSALAVSAFGEAVVPVSRDREILGRCILSSDLRSDPAFDALVGELGPEGLHAITGNVPGVQYSLPKLLWLRRHEPAWFRGADRLLLWGELIGWLLGGELLTNYSQINRTLLFDVRAERWSERMLALSGFDPAQLAPPVPSGTPAGTVSPSVARRLGLPQGVKLVVGGHDQGCTSLGAGVIRAGGAVCGIGTYECITPTYDRVPDPGPMVRRGLNVEHQVLPGLYISFIYNQSGALVRWFRDTFAGADRQLLPAGEELYEVLMRELPPEPTRLFTLPYFELTGPPDFVADASGVILGLKLGTTRGEILKSIMECSTLYLAEGIRSMSELGVETSELVATGGGARSDAWLQLKADIVGVPFVRPAFTEGSMLGAAMLAGMTTGVLDGPADAVARWVARGKVFEPDPRRHAVYQEKAAAYRQLFPLLRGFLAENEAREARRAPPR